MDSKFFDPKKLTISIVSHGQGNMVKNLLLDLEPLIKSGSQAILTLNIPENEQYLQDLPYQPMIIRNDYIKGFGENHNYAFSKNNRQWFAVINPDVRLDHQIFDMLLSSCSKKHAGVIAPLVRKSNGIIVDNARFYPTIGRIFSRLVNRALGSKQLFNYQFDKKKLLKVDWISGCFMLFNSYAFKLIGGFNSKFFMYLEDADICQRLHLSGFDVLVCAHGSIVHDGQYASRRKLRYLLWHLKSMNLFLKNNYYL